MAAKKKLVNENNLIIVFYLALPLLLLPPFFRGLFFPLESDVAHIYAALVLGLYVFLRKDYIRLSRNIMDYAWIGLIIAYIISNFVAFNKREALESALGIFNFFTVYWLLAQTVQREKDFKTALSVMYAAGFGVALAGLGTAFGTFWFNGAYDSGLILSTLQYHNATAIFLVACGIIGFYLTTALDNIWIRIVAGGLNYIIILTAFGAGSRGAMLVAPVGFILLIAGLPKEYRFKVFLNILAVLVPFFLTAKQVLNFGANSEGYHWGLLFIGVVVGCGSQAVVEKFLSLTADSRRRVITGVGIILTILAVGLVLFMGSKIMPTSIANRLSYVSLKDVNVQHRFYYYRDALQIIRDYPVFGIGGGGWNSLYPGYQRFLYFTTEVHSHPLRVWVETGTFGFVFYILLWVGLLITAFRITKKVVSPDYRAIAWTSAVAAISIFLHSTIDFSLSLGCVAILMFGLVGLVRGVERTCLDEEATKIKPVAGPLVRKVAGFTLAAVFFLVSTSLYLAVLKEREAVTAYNSGDVQGAVTLFEDAKTYDPLNYTYPMYLSSLYNNLAYQSKNPALARTSVENGQKAVELNKRASQPLWTLSQSYLLAGMPGESIATAEKNLKYAPWRQDSYDNLANIYLSSANQYLQSGRKDKAKEALEKVINLPRVIDNQVKSGVGERDIWFRGILEVDANIKQSVEQANKLLKSL
ncbi:MAG: O-antigen ligase family protein [Eubacteriales bacterium]